MAVAGCSWGRGSAPRAALLVLLGCAVWCFSASATTFTVGDTQGWDIGINYSNWTAGKTFAVGDVLFFPYASTQHDVAVVTESAYSSCATTNPLQTYTDGNTNVTLNETGAHYYICTFTGHCAALMKLAVTVGESNASTSTPASSTPGSPGSPGSRAASLTLPQPYYIAAAVSALLAVFAL